MATVTIEGIPTPVTVDEGFAALSPEQQSSTVDEIKAAWSARQQPAAPKDTSYSGALRHGAAQALQGVAATGRLVGSDTMESAGGLVTPNPNYDPATPALTDAVRNLDIRRAAGLLPRAIVENVPQMGVTAAAGAAGGLVGGPVGGLAAAGAASGAMSLGNNVETVAQNNGETTPSTGSIIQGGLVTAGSAALDAVGLRGVGRAVPASGALARLRQAGGASVREAGTEGAQDVGEQIGNSIGTERGVQYDPAQTVSAAVIGGGTRAAGSVPGAVVKGAGESVARAGAERAMGDMDEEKAASVERVNAALDRRAATTRGSNVPAEDVINGLREELSGDIHTLLEDGRDAGWYDTTAYRGLRRIFETAQRHNKALADGEPSAADVDSYGLDRLNQINAPEEFRSSIRDLLVDLDTISVAARKKNVTGPFEKMGDVAGRVAAIGGGLAAGGPMGALAGAAASYGANPLAARVGSNIGRKLDNLAGTRNPAVVLARQKAQSILEKAGRSDVGDSMQTVKGLNDLVSDERMTARILAGLPTDPVSMSAQLSRTIQRRLSKGLEVDEQEITKLRDDDKAKLLAWISEQDEVTDKKRSDRVNAIHEKMQAEQARRQDDLDRMAARGPAPDVDADYTAAEQARQTAEATRKERDAARAEAQRRSQDGQADKADARTLAAEERQFVSAQEAARRLLQQAQGKVAKEAATQAVAEAKAPEQLDALARADAAAKAREVEKAYAERNRQGATRDAAATAADKAAAAEAARKAAEEDAAWASRDEAPAGDNTDDVTRSQVSEWEATLSARRKALEAAQKASAPTLAPAAPKPVQPAVKPAMRPVTQTPEVAPQAAQPPTAQPAIEPAQEERRSTMPQGWNAGIMKFAWDNYQHRLTADQIDAALDKLQDDGKVFEDEAEHARSGGGRIARPLLELITQTALQDAGFDPRDPYKGAAHGPAPAGRPTDFWAGIHKPAAWESAKDSLQQHAAAWAQRAFDMGDTGLARDIGLIAAVGDGTTPGAQKVAIAKASIKAARDPDQKAIREAALLPLIARFNKKD